MAIQRGGKGAVSTPAGAVVELVPMKRKMKIYAITEDQLESLSGHDTRSKIGFALGGFALSQAASAKITMMSLEAPKSDLVVAFWGFGIAGLLLFAYAIYEWIERGGVVRRIRRESEPV